MYCKFATPRIHEREKLEAVVSAADNNLVCDGVVTRYEVEDLCRTVRVDTGKMFLPWRWDGEATEVLRRPGIVLRSNCDSGPFAPTQRQSFVDAKEASVQIDVVIFAVAEAITH